MEPIAMSFPALNTVDRLRAMFAVVVVGVFLLAVGSRMILAPHDPLGCVSVVSARLGWWIIPICVVLSFLISVLVSLASGAKLEELSVFSIALGLSLAELRFGNAGFLWASVGQGNDELRRSLAGAFVFESLGWVLVVAAAQAGSVLTTKKFGLRPIIERRPKEEYRLGLFTVLFMTVIALVGLQIFSAGTELAPVQSGQVCFALVASFYLAALIAYQLTGAHSPVWAYLAVGLVAVLGYAWTAVYPTPSFPGRTIANLAHFSPTSFGRALPVQMVMIGTASAIFGNWHQRQLTRHAVFEDTK